MPIKFQNHPKYVSLLFLFQEQAIQNARDNVGADNAEDRQRDVGHDLEQPGAMALPDNALDTEQPARLLYVIDEGIDKEGEDEEMDVEDGDEFNYYKAADILPLIN